MSAERIETYVEDRAMNQARTLGIIMLVTFVLPYMLIQSSAVFIWDILEGADLRGFSWFLIFLLLALSMVTRAETTGACFSKAKRVGVLGLLPFIWLLFLADGVPLKLQLVILALPALNIACSILAFDPENVGARLVAFLGSGLLAVLFVLPTAHGQSPMSALWSGYNVHFVVTIFAMIVLALFAVSAWVLFRVASGRVESGLFLLFARVYGWWVPALLVFVGFIYIFYLPEVSKSIQPGFAGAGGLPELLPLCVFYLAFWLGAASEMVVLGSVAFFVSTPAPLEVEVSETESQPSPGKLAAEEEDVAIDLIPLDPEDVEPEITEE